MVECYIWVWKAQSQVTSLQNMTSECWKCHIYVAKLHVAVTHFVVGLFRVVKSSWLPAKIATYLVSIGQLLCLAFLYRWCFLNKISLDWLVTLTTQPSISNFLTTLVVGDDEKKNITNIKKHTIVVQNMSIHSHPLSLWKF